MNIPFTFLFSSSFGLVSLWLGFYPGCVTVDGVNQLKQIFSGQYSNHHPVFGTFIMQFFWTIAHCFYDDNNFALSIYLSFQCVICALCFSYCIMTLFQKGLKKLFCTIVFV